MEYRYWMSCRTAVLGTIPIKNLVEIKDYDYSRYNDDVGEYVWGYVVYSEPLTEQEIARYGLMEGGTVSD